MTRRSPALRWPPLPPAEQTGDQANPRGPRAGAQRLAPLNLLGLPASLLTIAFTGQRLLNAQFLARLQVKGMSLDFPDYVLLQDLPLEALERVLKRLAFLEPYLSQSAPPTSTRIPMSGPERSIAVLSSYPSLLVLGFQNLAAEDCSSRIEVHHFRAVLTRREPSGGIFVGNGVIIHYRKSRNRRVRLLRVASIQEEPLFGTVL